MMESAPSTDAVYQGVYTLYNNGDAKEKEKASKWLEQLQNSVNDKIDFLSRIKCLNKHNITKLFDIFFFSAW